MFAHVDWRGLRRIGGGIDIADGLAGGNVEKASELRACLGACLVKNLKSACEVGLRYVKAHWLARWEKITEGCEELDVLELLGLKEEVLARLTRKALTLIKTHGAQTTVKLAVTV